MRGGELCNGAGWLEVCQLGLALHGYNNYLLYDKLKNNNIRVLLRLSKDTNDTKNVQSVKIELGPILGARDKHKTRAHTTQNCPQRVDEN